VVVVSVMRSTIYQSTDGARFGGLPHHNSVILLLYVFYRWWVPRVRGAVKPCIGGYVLAGHKLSITCWPTTLYVCDPDSCLACVTSIGYGHYGPFSVFGSQWVGVLCKYSSDFKECRRRVGAEKLLAAGHVTSCCPAYISGRGPVSPPLESYILKREDVREENKN